jgi:amidase
MARTVNDLALLFGTIADPMTATPAQPSALVELKGMRVAWYTHDGVAPVDQDTASAVAQAAHILEQAGLTVINAQPAAVLQGSRLWIDLFSHAAAAEIRRLYRGRESEAGRAVSALIAAGVEIETGMEANIKAAERLAKAVVEREQFREQLLKWMKTTPLLIAPVGSTNAFPHGSERLEINGPSGPESVNVFRAFSYSQTFNVFGFPSVVVPITRTAAGLPIGVQIVAPPFKEDLALGAAAMLETAAALPAAEFS